MCGEMLCGAKGELDISMEESWRIGGKRWRMVGICRIVVMGGMGRILENVENVGIIGGSVGENWGETWGDLERIW